MISTTSLSSNFCDQYHPGQRHSYMHPNSATIQGDKRKKSTMDTSDCAVANNTRQLSRQLSSHSARTASGAQQNQSTAAPQTGQTQTTVSENTPINSNSVHRDYQSTEGMRNRSSGSENSQQKGKNSPQAQDGATDANGNAGDGENHHRPWYIMMANRYGSLELENKGSVARDHLALGIFVAFLSFLFCLYTNDELRTNVSSLAKNIIGFCIHWDRNYPTIPPEQR